MSVYGDWLAATLTSSTTSAEVNLGKDYDFLEIQIPELDSAATIKIQVAEEAGGDYLDLGDGITTAAGTHDYHDVFKLGGWQFIKVVASVSQDDVKIRVRGMRY